MIGNYWYWRFYAGNVLYDLKRQYRIYGLRSFVPHRHLPHPYPAADGAYCRACGTRKAIVQKRWRNT
jgi:hypothetical protein